MPESNMVDLKGQRGASANESVVMPGPAPDQIEVYRLAANYCRDLISVHEGNGDYAFASPSAEVLFGWKPAALTGRSAYQFLHPDDIDRIASNHATQRGGDPAPIEYRVRCADGSYRWVETRSQPRLGPSGEVQWIVCVTRDIQDRKDREAQTARIIASRASQEEAMIALCAGVAHELAAPLSVALGNVELAAAVLGDSRTTRGQIADLDADRGPGEAINRSADQAAQAEQAAQADQIAQYLDGARAAFVRARALAADLQAFARRAATHEYAEPAACVQSILAMMGPRLARRAHLERALEPTPPVAMSELRLGQVVGNLLRNAQDAQPDRVEVRTMVDERGWAVIEVADTGCGMLPEIRDRVFEPFFTTKSENEGAGIGLSVVRGLVDDAGGEITVESSPGYGSRFTVSLPPVSVDSSSRARP